MSSAIEGAPTATVMCMYSASKGPSTTAVCKYAVFKGSPNSQSNVYVLCFQKGRQEKVHCVSTLRSKGPTRASVSTPLSTATVMCKCAVFNAASSSNCKTREVGAMPACNTLTFMCCQLCFPNLQCF